MRIVLLALLMGAGILGCQTASPQSASLSDSAIPDSRPSTVAPASGEMPGTSVAGFTGLSRSSRTSEPVRPRRG